jgi:UDP-2-acetamido-2,6-beta-L-arabino-hexul-4-ose reductase
MNRHPDPEVIFNNNISLVKELISSWKEQDQKLMFCFHHLLRKKKITCTENLKKKEESCFQNGQKDQEVFTGMIIPNVFGPFGKPNYNSFIATFCHKLTHGEAPSIDNDGEVRLIYVGELVQEIINNIQTGETRELYEVSHTSVNKVSEVLEKLENFKQLYFDNGEIPELKTKFDLNLFNTFRCYFDIKNHYPVKFTQHVDPRGAFVEVIRLGIGGQCSFSTTVPELPEEIIFIPEK